MSFIGSWFSNSCTTLIVRNTYIIFTIYFSHFPINDAFCWTVDLNDNFAELLLLFFFFLCVWSIKPTDFSALLDLNLIERLLGYFHFTFIYVLFEFVQLLRFSIQDRCEFQLNDQCPCVSPVLL